MLMIDCVAGFVDHSMSRANSPIKHIEVAAAGERRSGIEGFIETTEFDQQRTSKCHVAAGTKFSRSYRVQRVAMARATKFEASKTPPEAAAEFEEKLRLCIEPVR